MRIAYFIGVAILALVIFAKPGEIVSWFPQSMVREQPPATTVTFHPNAVAKQPNLGLVVIPGAVICSNFANVQLVISMYQEHFGEMLQDRISQGQSVLLRGPAMPVPELESLGCSLLSPETPMRVEPGLGYLVPRVSARLPDGTIVRGVTHPLMFDWNEEMQKKLFEQEEDGEQRARWRDNNELLKQEKQLDDQQKASNPQAWQKWQDIQKAFQEQQEREKAARDAAKSIQENR